MPSAGWIGPLDGVGLHHRAAALVGEQVHRVRGVVPQQVVGPAARLAQRVHVAAAEEIGLHIHLLDVELARLDLVVHPLVAGVEAARVAAHRHQAAGFGHAHRFLAIGQHVAQRNLHLHMLAGAQAGQGLAGVHLGGGAEDDRIHLGQGQAVGQVGRDMADAVLGRHFLRLVQLAADDRDHLHAVDVSDAIDVLDAEGASTGQRHLDCLRHVSCSPGSGGPPRCCWRAHGRSGGAGWGPCRRPHRPSRRGR